MHLRTIDSRAEMQMRFQLVLQWPASSIEGYVTLVEIEEVLINGLTAGSEVDGHDAGFDQVNIFIRTDYPERTFEEARSVLAGTQIWPDVRVAYRDLEGTKYIVLWPKWLTKFAIT